MAGYVDAVGFLLTGGFFVSFMSGNSTRLAVGLAEGAGYAGLAFALIAAFVAGVSTGAFLGRKAGARRWPPRSPRLRPCRPPFWSWPSPWGRRTPSSPRTARSASA